MVIIWYKLFTNRNVYQKDKCTLVESMYIYINIYIYKYWKHARSSFPFVKYFAFVRISSLHVFHLLISCLNTRKKNTVAVQEFLPFRSL